MDGTKKSRLLIVDDDEGMRRTMRRIMLAKEFDVEVAESGEAAISAAARLAPDVALLDMKMPGMNGVETFQRLKLICPNVVAIFMTAFSSVELTEEARREGGLHVFSKPIDVDALLNLITKAQTSISVLLVDNDAGFRTSLERTLIANGFRVRTAVGVEDAVAEFQIDPSSVVLLDMKLDGSLSGLDVLRQIQQVNTEVIAILMTGFQEFEPQLQTGMQCGAYGSFVKPFDIDALIQQIKSTVSHT